MVMSGAINFYIHEIKFLRKHEYGHWVWYLYAQDCVTDAKRVLGNYFRTRQSHHITFQVLSLFPDQEIILIKRISIICNCEATKVWTTKILLLK